MEEEVIGYIKSARGHGMSDSEIKQNLLNAGWEAEVVEDSFTHVRALDSQENLPARPPETHIPGHMGQPIRPSEVLTHNTANFPNPTTGISETTFQTDALNKPFYKKAWVWIVALLVALVIGGAGYWYMAYGFNTPQGIWKKFTSLNQSKVYKNKFLFNYIDTGEFSSKDLGTFSLKDLKLTFDGQSYVDVRDEKNPQSSAEIQYTFGSGNTNFSTGFKYRILNRILYLNVGENPFLNNIFASLGKGEKVDWIKIDLNALQDEMNQSGTNTQAEFDKIFDNQLKSEISKIWEDATFVKIQKYAGREQVNGVNTVHFINTLDKQAIKDALTNSLTKIADSVNAKATSDADKLQDKDLSLAKIAINGLVDKLEVKDFETWVGVRDFRLYRVKFESNAPSVTSAMNLVVNEALSGAKEKSRDAKRLADMRQMASALELYYNDMNGYPEAKNGVPDGGITPMYIGLVPVSPTPADGSCTDYYNTYWYQPKGEKMIVKGKTVYSDYEMTFCLGSDVGGYKAGIAKLSPQGIEGNIACPTSDEKCVSANPAPAEPVKTPEQQVQDFVDKLDYSAQIKIDANYSDYEKPEAVQVPDNALDLIEATKGQVQGLFIKAPDATAK